MALPTNVTGSGFGGLLQGRTASHRQVQHRQVFPKLNATFRPNLERDVIHALPLPFDNRHIDQLETVDRSHTAVRGRKSRRQSPRGSSAVNPGPGSGKATRVIKTPKGKGKQDKSTRITTETKALLSTNPLSSLTQHMKEPLRDIQAMVSRANDVRQGEIDEKGRIKRPMNAFILYRTAYTERIKAYFRVSNHQMVSCIAGASWSAEDAVVKRRFQKWASLEQDQHLSAHPEYKFRPGRASDVVGDLGNEEGDLENYHASPGCENDSSNTYRSRRRRRVSQSSTRHVSAIEAGTPLSRPRLSTHSSYEYARFPEQPPTQQYPNPVARGGEAFRDTAQGHGRGADVRQSVPSRHTITRLHHSAMPSEMPVFTPAAGLVSEPVLQTTDPHLVDREQNHFPQQGRFLPIAQVMSHVLYDTASISMQNSFNAGNDRHFTRHPLGNLWNFTVNPTDVWQPALVDQQRNDQPQMSATSQQQAAVSQDPLRSDDSLDSVNEKVEVHHFDEAFFDDPTFTKQTDPWHPDSN